MADYKTIASAKKVEPQAESKALAGNYHAYWAELCRYLKGRFGDGPPEPQDVAQQAFIQFAAMDDSAEVQNPRAFLYRIAINLATRQHQREGMISRYNADHAEEARESYIDDVTPERQLMARERMDILNGALEHMAEEPRRMLVLNRMHGLSYAEISRRTGVSQTQVKRLVAEALMVCKKSLRDANGGPRP